MKVANMFNFKGVVDAREMLNSSLFSTGDVVLVGNDAYVFADGRFQKLSKVKNLSDNDSQSTGVQVSEQRCKSCGAPLMIDKYSKSAIVCEYCRSTYSVS